MRLRRLLVVAVASAFVLFAGAMVAVATINSAANKAIVLGNGSTTQFTFSFVGDQPGYISVTFTDASGNQTVLTQGPGATQYQLVLNPAVSPGLWGIGGTVTYNPSGTPIASGTTLTIVRTLPFVQNISLLNLASLSALSSSAETGLDQLEMQIQQVAENVNRVVAGPLSDPPGLNYTLPPAAQRANTGLAFDGSGNVIAGVIPASGIISSAMQPVVSAASLAAGRAAFGLGSAATGAINYGLQQGISGPNLIDVNSTPVQDAINQTAVASFHQTQRICTGPISYTLPRANTTWAGYGFWVYAVSGVCTITPNAADNFLGAASGVSIAVNPGSWVYITTNAATNATWWVDYHGPTSVNLVAGSNGTALTLTLYSGPIQFRDTTLANGDPVWSLPANGISITIPSSATLGTSSGNKAFRLWEFVAYNGGTPVLGVATCSNPTTIFSCRVWETQRITAAAITTGSTAPGTLYTSSAITNDSVVIVGYVDYANGLATAGTWASVPTTQQSCLPPRQCPRPGDTVQGPIYGTFTGLTTGSGVTQTQTATTLSITPSSSPNLVLIEADGVLSTTSGTPLSQLSRGTSPTLIGNLESPQPTVANQTMVTHLKALDAPNTASATSYFVFIRNAAAGGNPSWNFAVTGATPTAAMMLWEIMGAIDVPANDNGDFSLSKAA